MPKRSSKPAAGSPRAVIALALMALALFLGGEALILGRTDSGRILAARYLHIGDRAEVTRLVGRQLHRGLEITGVRRDSIREEGLDPGPVALRWRVGLKPGASLLQANYAITRTLEAQGAAVISGREHPGRRGGQEITLVAGLPHRPTHEIVI